MSRFVQRCSDLRKSGYHRAMQDGAHGTTGTLVVTASRSKDISVARRFVRTTLRDIVPAHVAADMELITSELVTNAVRHGSREPLVVTVHADRRVTSVTIEHEHDQLDDIPRIAEWEIPDPELPSGRGLGLVRALSDEVTVGVHGDTLSITASVATELSPTSTTRRESPARRPVPKRPAVRLGQQPPDTEVIDVVKEGYHWFAVRDGETLTRASTKREVLRRAVAAARHGGPPVRIRLHTAAGALQKEYLITPDGARRPA
jgi:anti-sigma regulatory factor (Ser/Thr protein kinase)